MNVSAEGVCTVYDRYLERYTACQVAYVAPPDNVNSQSWAMVLSLDWVSDAPLTAEGLPHLRPLYRDFICWPRELHLLRAPVGTPPQYALVGILPSFADEPCHPHGRWDDGYEVYRQIEQREIPEERRRVFKEAVESDGEMGIGDKPVKVNNHRVIDQYTPFGFALELEALPCFSKIIYKQWYPDLAEFLRGGPFIHELTLLNRDQRTLGLQGTSIGKLVLDMTGLEELWPGKETEQLLFQNKGPDAYIIHAAENGSGLTLQSIGEYRPHPELPNLWGLRGIRLEEFDMTGLLIVHPGLKGLRFQGTLGDLRDFSAVTQFQGLADLSTFDPFGFDAADVPALEQMPKLHWFWMASLPEDAVRAAKQL